MTKKTLVTFLSFSILFSLLLGLSGAQAAKSKRIAINEANFPDPEFRKVLLARAIDRDRDGYLDESERQMRTTISLENKGIKSLKGIEFLTSLEQIWCNDNELTELDVSQIKYLRQIYCKNNQLTRIDLSKNEFLTIVDLSGNQLTEIIVGKSWQLKEFYAGNNRLTSMDVSSLPKLNYFSVSGNSRKITAKDGTFDLSALPGFDVSKASDWKNGTVEGTMLTVEESGPVTYKYDCGNDHSASFTLDVTVTGAPAKKKTELTVSAPKPICDLVYSGSEMALVTAGSVENDYGILYYAATRENAVPSDDQFSTAIPTATEAGTWFVWYKAVGDDDHLNTEMAFVKVTIAEAAKPEEEKEKETGEQPAPPETANGLINDPQLGWVLMKNGAVDTGYTGLYSDPAIGWWFIRNGAIDWDYVGLFNDPNVGWWLISGGTIAWDYTGLWDDANYGWWLIAGGRLCAEYTGLWNDPNYGWWLIGGGRLCSEYTGLWNDPNYGWWLIAEGRLCAEYTGLWEDPSLGWWLIQNGTIAFDYTGLWNDQNYGWWLIGSGTIAFDYTGLWNDPVCGWWLIRDGQIDFGYTGDVNAFDATWHIVNGQLVF